MPECPVRVDWQSRDCESQILIVLSQLPLAICFPSGLHATDVTLKLREVIHISTEAESEKLEKKLTDSSARSPSTRSVKKNFKKRRRNYLSECPLRVDSTNPVRASQTTTRPPSARASLDPSGEKATASISSPPRIVNLHARRLCRGLTCSMKA